MLLLDCVTESFETQQCGQGSRNTLWPAIHLHNVYYIYSTGIWDSDLADNEHAPNKCFTFKISQDQSITSWSKNKVQQFFRYQTAVIGKATISPIKLGNTAYVKRFRLRNILTLLVFWISFLMKYVGLEVFYLDTQSQNMQIVSSTYRPKYKTSSNITEKMYSSFKYVGWIR